MRLGNIKQAIENAGGNFCIATRQEYEKAIASLGNEWSPLSALPCDFHFYRTLKDLNIAAHKTEQLYGASDQMRGFCNYFRLAA